MAQLKVSVLSVKDRRLSGYLPFPPSVPPSLQCARLPSIMVWVFFFFFLGSVYYTAENGRKLTHV